MAASACDTGVGVRGIRRIGANGPWAMAFVLKIERWDRFSRGSEWTQLGSNVK